MGTAHIRKRIGPPGCKFNWSWSKRGGLKASVSARSTNKKGLGTSYNSKTGLTLSVRGTGIRYKLGWGGSQAREKEKKS